MNVREVVSHGRLWRGAVVIVAACLMATMALAGSQEDCLASGSCICYEPLNADDGPFGNDAFANPSDSSQKECDGFFLEGGGDTVSSVDGEPDLDMPGNGVSYVWEVNQSGTQDSHLGDSLGLSLSPGQTLCYSGYERVNFTGVGSKQRSRITRFGTSSGAQSVLQWTFGSNPAELRMTNTMAGADQNCDASGGITTADASDSWIRYQHCLDLDSSNTLHFRARAKVLDTGATWETSCTETGSTGGLSFNMAWPANVFSQNGDGGWKRWKSHVSAWKTSYDASFWPPAAAEVEGGGGSTQPPPPPEPPEDDPPSDDPPEDPVSTGCSSSSSSGFFCEGFENGALANFQDVNAESLRVQTSAAATGSSALEASIPAGSQGDGWASRFFGDHPNHPNGSGSQQENVVIEGQVRFSPGFDFTRVTKVFNLASFEGWNAGYADPLSWSPYYFNIAVDESGRLFGELRSKTSSGPTWRELPQNLGSTIAFSSGRWYRVEIQVKLNDPGTSNGVFRAWVNGTKYIEHTGLDVRGSYDAYGLNHLILTPYHQESPSSAQSLYWDDVFIGQARRNGGGGLTAPGRPMLME